MLFSHGEGATLLLSFPSVVGSVWLKWAFLCWQFEASLLVVSGILWHLLAMASVVSYSPPWWVNLLHRLPHFNLRFEQTSSDFQPEDWTYQQVKYPTELFAACKHPVCLFRKWSVLSCPCPGLRAYVCDSVTYSAVWTHMWVSPFIHLVHPVTFWSMSPSVSGCG